MYSINKNSYLQVQYSSINPRTLNRCVDRAREFEIPFDTYDLEPPFQRLTSEQPNIPIEHCDVTRRAEAFGRWALPKLRRELHGADRMVQLQALRSIADLIRDPEKAYEAMNLKIPDRLADLLLDDLAPIKEGAAIALCTFATYEEGKRIIAKNQAILENLNTGITDSKLAIRLKVAECLELLSTSWIVSDDLVCFGFIEILLERVTQDIAQIAVLHLTTLKHLMYDVGVNVALNLNAYRTFDTLLESKSNDILCKTLDCLMVLMATKEGKKIALEKNFLKTLNRIIQYGNIDVCTSAVPVIMFCTVKTKAKHAAAEIRNLPKRLIHLAINPQNQTLQMYCLKALTNICEHPKVRKYIQERYMETIERMQVGADNKEHKQILLRVINWLPENLS